MAYADVLFLDDCSDDSNEAFGQNIDQHVKDLVDPAKRKAAMNALSVHPYAADDLVNSPAWPTFCHSLTDLLAEPDLEVSTAAVDLAGKIFQEVRHSKPHELADLCLSLAAYVAIGRGDSSLTAICRMHPPSTQRHRDEASGDSSVQPVQPEVAPCEAVNLQSIRDGSLQGISSRQAGIRADTDGQTRDERAAVRAAAVKLLVRCLQALPRMWATFRDTQLQQLWDAVCPLLKLDLRSPASSSAQQLSGGGNANLQQRTPLAAAGASAPTACSDGPSIGDGNYTGMHGRCAGLAVAQQQMLGVTGAVALPDSDGEFCGPLVEMCSAEGWSGDWWKAWTTPARPARWLPAALQRHSVLPGLIQACSRLADSPKRCYRASAAETFAVQTIGSILALSLGRKLFPISIASQAVPNESEQATVEDAIMCLSRIATQPLRAEAPQVGSTWVASEVALDALHMLYRDDSPDFKFLTQRNIAFLAAELETSTQSAGTDAYTMKVQRRLECMLSLLARTAYGRSLLNY